MNPLLIVDAANVVGSVPNGWWKDRPGAARRLRHALVPVVRQGLAQAELAPPLDVVMVVEGDAATIANDPGGSAEGDDEVRVVAADGSGDDAIVDLVRANDGRDYYVVTADRGLRERVTALGALVLGPRTLPHLAR